MNRFDIALNKPPPSEPPKKEAPVVDAKKPKKPYLLQMLYRSTLNSLPPPVTKIYEAGEVVMAGSEPLGICTTSDEGSPYERAIAANPRISYCHGSGTVFSTNRVAVGKYVPGDKLVSVNGLLAKQSPDDGLTVVGVVLNAESDGTLLIQMRI
jgi:hypothetical protein